MSAFMNLFSDDKEKTKVTSATTQQDEGFVGSFVSTITKPFDNDDSKPIAPSRIPDDLPFVTTLAGSGVAGYMDTVASRSAFNNPTSICIDSKFNVYVADHFNHRIRRITPHGEVVTVAGSGSPGFQNGVGVNASFSNPRGVVVDEYGILYVTDSGNHAVRKVAPSGEVTTLAGSGLYGYKDGTGGKAQFHHPTGLCLDKSGCLYIADTGNHCIRKIKPDGSVETFTAKDGKSGNKDGKSKKARFSSPIGVCMDSIGNLYITDSGNSLIRKSTPKGEVTTFVGSGERLFRPGQGKTAAFAGLGDIGMDFQGNLYVVDTSANRVLKIQPNGLVASFAGTGVKSSADGPYDTAGFASPTGVAFDPYGHLLVADAANNRVRKIFLPKHMRPNVPPQLATSGSTTPGGGGILGGLGTQGLFGNNATNIDLNGNKLNGANANGANGTNGTTTVNAASPTSGKPVQNVQTAETPKRSCRSCSSFTCF